MRWVWCFVLLAGCDAVYDLRGRGLDGAAPDECPASYVSIDNTPPSSKYRIVAGTGIDWLGADGDCVNDSIGITHLVVFDDTTELDAIKDLLTSQQAEWNAWVGYARDSVANPQIFYAVTGEPIDQTSLLWAPDEPSNGGDGEEAVYFANWGRLTDVRFDARLSLHVCECDGRMETQRFVFTR